MGNRIFAGYVIKSNEQRSIDFSGSAELTTKNTQMPPFKIQVANTMVLSEKVLKFNFGGTFQGFGFGGSSPVTLVVKDCGFIFDQPNLHFKLGVDCLHNNKRYKGMVDIDSYKVIEVTIEGPEPLGPNMGRKVSFVSKNDIRGGLDFSISLQLTQPTSNQKAYGLTIEGTEKKSGGSRTGFDIKGR